MLQELHDRLVPEVAPGKFLYQGTRWSSHAFLIDVRIRSQLIWVSRVATALLCVVVVFAVIYLPQPGMEPYFYGSALLGTAVIAGSMTGLSQWLVSHGERVHKSEIDPKFASPSYFAVLLNNPLLEKLPRWVLWTVAIFMGIVAAIRILPLMWAVTRGAQPVMAALTAIGVDLVQISIVWVCVHELQARRRKTRASRILPE